MMSDIAEPKMTVSAPSLPRWVAGAAAIGVLWNAYGVYQFAGSLSATATDLMSGGMTEAQATLYLALPFWMTLVFAVGVAGGLIGSVLILMRSRMAVPVLTASLAGYLALFAGDVAYGVFAGIPQQLAILGVVVVIAAVLLWIARHARARSQLV